MSLSDRPASSALETAENYFFPQRSAIKRDLDSGLAIDYNRLSATGKRAAFSLIQEARARLIDRGGRRFLVGRRPNTFLDLLTAGFFR